MTEVKATFPEVNYEEVKKVLEANGTKGVVIDVRHPKELEEDGWVPGFINIPLDSVKMAFVMEPLEFEIMYHAKKPDPKQDVIFSCRSGRRAMMAAESLQEMETYPNIKVYAGSFQDWIMNGGDFTVGPLTKDGKTPGGDRKTEEDVNKGKEGGGKSQEDKKKGGGDKSEGDSKNDTEGVDQQQKDKK